MFGHNDDIESFICKGDIYSIDLMMYLKHGGMLCTIIGGNYFRIYFVQEEHII